ncbi:MAG: hypothetical protein HC899_37555 [Leptolyngbyaceae cyanobacterium SM1_4_3]|nr:hypothetical protein [Leptolyngbyaceae cyanobacterium SM1_4_3]
MANSTAKAEPFAVRTGQGCKSGFAQHNFVLALEVYNPIDSCSGVKRSPGWKEN